MESNISISKDLTSNCTVCGEVFVTNGNYLFKVLPSKRIPKKAIRLKKSTLSKSSSSHFETSMWGLTKFQKYLLKRSVAKNYCELTCRNCNAVCKFPMTKPAKVFRSTINNLERNSSTPNSFCNSTPLSSDGSSKPKRKKKKKEVNAGLIIPESFRPNPASNIRNDTPFSSKLSSQTQPQSSHPSQNVRAPNNTNILNQTTAQNLSTPLQQTAFRNLQKALFKSKNMDSTPSKLSKLLN